MIYLDYGATTPVNNEVLETFIKCNKEFIGNPNSLHKLGVKSKELIDEAIKQIANLLKIKTTEIIITSSSSESNNTAIKGIAFKYQNKGKHIITSDLEHSSIYGPLNYLQDFGFEVDFVDTLQDGKVDLEHLKSLIREDTILVSISSVNSELGIIQPIDEIGKLLKEKNIIFHSDMTQSVGKININLANVDLITFAPHKFYGLKGVGCLIKKENIKLIPLIHGGKSTTSFRSSTPALPLIVSLAKALRLAIENLEKNYNIIKELNYYLKDKLEKLSYVHINSPKNSLEYFVNFSISNIKPETMLHALASEDIYISTQSACSSSNTPSRAVLNVTNDLNLAKTSMRVSLSHLTTKEEIDKFLVSLDNNYHKLNLKGNI